jgi:hypothetical protein
MSSPSRLLLSLALTVSCISLIAFDLVSFRASAQQPDCTHCTPGPNNGTVENAKKSSWAQGTTVEVYIDPAFGQISGGVQAIKDAFTNWTNAGGSGVTFQFYSTPRSGPNTHNVYRQEPGLGADYQGETGGSFGSNGHRSTAFTSINPGVTSAAALRQGNVSRRRTYFWIG